MFKLDSWRTLIQACLFVAFTSVSVVWAHDAMRPSTELECIVDSLKSSVAVRICDKYFLTDKEIAYAEEVAHKKKQTDEKYKKLFDDLEPKEEND